MAVAPAPRAAEATLVARVVVAVACPAAVPVALPRPPTPRHVCWFLEMAHVGGCGF